MQRTRAVLVAILVGLGIVTAAVTPAAATVAPVGASVQALMAVRPAPYPLRCRVTANNVNYRRGPGKQYASLGQVNRGFRFASDGGVPNPHSRLQYWDNIRRPGHADGYIDDVYVFCWLA
jgi:hypothetical protein